MNQKEFLLLQLHPINTLDTELYLSLFGKSHPHFNKIILYQNQTHELY